MRETIATKHREIKTIKQHARTILSQVRVSAGDLLNGTNHGHTLALEDHTFSLSFRSEMKLKSCF